MASTCPKCHENIPDDGVCCADIQYTWKCKKCFKLETGLVVPYGKCFLCGGELEVVDTYNIDDPEKVEPIKKALQFEVNAYFFYKMAKEKTANLARQEVLEELRLKEQDHIQTIIDKYHVHLDKKVFLEVPESAEKILEDEMFKGITFDENESCLKGIYEKAIAIEQRTREFFLSQADTLPDGSFDQSLYKELAAEEDEHIALLETEMAQFDS